MKYSILGFNQALVCDLRKEVQHEDGSTKTLYLDVTDLLILKNIADFMNRSQVVKLMINDNVYFSITQKTIIEDLPILRIKKQALKDRIDKMILLGVIEKEVLRNECGTWIGYRLTDVYERLRYYDAKNSEGGCSQLHEGGVAQYYPNNNTTINVNIKEEDTNVSPKKELFEECWKLYGRKGSKKNALIQWDKLKQEDYDKIKIHIPFYIKSNEFVYLKDFERYLKGRVFESKVVNKEGQTLFDPERENSKAYSPICGANLMWNDFYNTYVYLGYWDGVHIYDGYKDDDRPDGAKIMLNNGQVRLTWSKETKTWNK